MYKIVGKIKSCNYYSNLSDLSEEMQSSSSPESTETGESIDLDPYEAEISILIPYSYTQFLFQNTKHLFIVSFNKYKDSGELLLLLS